MIIPLLIVATLVWVRETDAMPLDMKSIATLTQENAFNMSADEWQPKYDANKTAIKWATAKCDKFYKSFENDTYF